MLGIIFLNLFLSTELWIFGISSVSSNEKNIDVAKRSVVKKIPLNGDWAWMTSDNRNSPAGLAVTTDCVAKNSGWVTVTIADENPAWAIYLQGLYIVHNVIVTAPNDNRGAERFEDIYIFVTEYRTAFDRDRDYKLSNAFFKGPASTHQRVSFTFTAEGKYVEIVLKSYYGTELKLCHVEIFGEHKSTTQVYEKLHLDYSAAWMTSELDDAPAGRAVTSFCDRFTKLASSTREETNPGWAIYFSKFYYVKTIEVTVIYDADRARRFKDVYAFVTQEKLVIDDNYFYFAYACANFKGPASKHETVIFECNKIGQHVSIVLHHESQFLELCRVGIYGSSELNAKRISLNPNLAWMTSVLPSGSFTGDRAVRQTCQTVFYLSSTYRERNPGWAIDLKKKFFVTIIYVTVVNLAEEVHCFQDVHFFAREERPRLGNMNYGESCAYYKGPPSKHETIGFGCNEAGRYVAISIESSSQFLRLCHVDIYGLRWNLNRLPLNSSSAKQSSDYNSKTIASLAIDGNFNLNSKYCTYTNLERGPWWVIDLESLSFVSHVKFWTQKDIYYRYYGIRVLLAYSNVERFIQCAPRSFTRPSDGVYNIRCNRLALRVKIAITSKEQYLSLCEVVVYGEIAHKLARPHSATQSSTYQHLVANNAIDGKNNQADHNDVVSLTKKETDPWWSVELRKKSFVTFIQIWKLYYNPGDMENFKVFLSDQNESYQEECFGRHIPARHSGVIFLLHCGYVAEKMKISVSGINQVLMLAQVEVLGYYEE